MAGLRGRSGALLMSTVRGSMSGGLWRADPGGRSRGFEWFMIGRGRRRRKSDADSSLDVRSRLVFVFATARQTPPPLFVLRHLMYTPRQSPYIFGSWWNDPMDSHRASTTSAILSSAISTSAAGFRLRPANALILHCCLMFRCPSLVRSSVLDASNIRRCCYTRV